MSNAPAQHFRVSQMIVVALASGSILFGGLATALRLTDSAPAASEATAILQWVALGLPVMVLPAYFVVRMGLIRQAQGMKEQGLEQVRQDLHPPPLRALTILGCALAEGPALFAAVTILLGGPLWLLGVVGVAVLAMIAQFPTRERAAELLRDPAH